MVLRIEQDIIGRVVDALLATGMKLSVLVDGEAVGLAVFTRDRELIIEDIMAVEECALYSREGAVLLVRGNNGYDVVSDYSETLEQVMAPVNEYIDRRYF